MMAALFALLAFAPFASAASDPVETGTTTLTLNNGFTKSLKKKGVKILKVSPTTLKGAKATFKVTGGSVDPTTGAGTVNLSGGLKFKAGKKSATVKGLVLDTTKKSLTGNVGGKKLKFGAVAGYSFSRAGFGVSMKIGKLKLTGPAAKQLNKKLGLKGKKVAFKANAVMGSAKAEEQPLTVTVMPGGNLRLATAEATIKKLLDVKVSILTQSPTAVVDSTPTHPVYDFPITGGTVAPTATAGTIQSAGGLNLVQDLGGGTKTEISLGNFYYDLAAKTVTVEVVAHSTASKELDLGALGRSSIADVTLTGATVTADPTAHTVSVQNAAATLQPVSASVLDAFRKVIEGGLVLKLIAEGAPKATAEMIAAEAFAKDHINAGDPLGTFSFTAQTQ
jgi:hypothetical protein